MASCSTGSVSPLSIPSEASSNRDRCGFVFLSGQSSREAAPGSGMTTSATRTRRSSVPAIPWIMPSWAKIPRPPRISGCALALMDRVPLIYFLGFAPGLYQAIIPAFIAGWDATRLIANIAFGLPGEAALSLPKTAPERRYALDTVKKRCIKERSGRPSLRPIRGAAPYQGSPRHDSWMRRTSLPTATPVTDNRSCPTASRSPRSTTRPSMPT